MEAVQEPVLFLVPRTYTQHVLQVSVKSHKERMVLMTCWILFLKQRLCLSLPAYSYRPHFPAKTMITCLCEIPSQELNKGRLGRTESQAIVCSNDFSPALSNFLLRLCFAKSICSFLKNIAFSTVSKPSLYHILVLT